jgi:hypothetical protein
MKKILILSLLLFISKVSAAENIAPSKQDEYITGYVQSIFVFGYNLPSEAVSVDHGVIRIKESMLGSYNSTDILEKTKNATSDLRGVKGVVLDTSLPSESAINKEKARVKPLPSSANYIDIAMPNRSLFDPLIADPKWPRFTAAYQNYSQGRGLKHVFAPNFGASFPLYRLMNEKKDIEWELGVQAGLFGIMNIGTNPTALVNADYFVGAPVTYRSGSWSGLARFYHVSSHLGDEFMLTPEGKKTQRINLSYEGVDLLLSHNFDGLRLYGGGGYIVHKEPSYIKPLKVQFGGEYYAHETFMHGRFRPVMAIDIKTEEQGRWAPGISYKVGVQLENAALISNKVQLMLEFYSGKSFHGQFYKERIRYIGIGLQAFL